MIDGDRQATYSFIVTFATRGSDARAGAFQCPDEAEINAGNLDMQHFCCSAECAAKCAHACIDEHLLPQHHAHVAALAEQDAAEAQERAAMEAHRQAMQRQAMLVNAPAPTADDGPPTLLAIPVVSADPDAASAASTTDAASAPVETAPIVAHDAEGERDASQQY